MITPFFRQTMTYLRPIVYVSLILTLLQCQAKNHDSADAKGENYAELKELLKNANKTGSNISFVAAAAISTPCVVHIKTKINVVVNTVSPFHDLFGNEFFYQQPRNQKQESSGSGVIVAKDGMIITNYHVIQNATEIEVTLRNKNTYKAKVIGTDKDTDLALIKIEETNLPAIEIANSDSVMVGEWVLAVGNPFNLESTVTQGIVSAKGRSLHIDAPQGRQGQSSTPIESFIQTDAAVNPGNSGGALVNLNGELIGINTAIASPTGAYAGYAFAVPSNIVRKVIQDLKQFGQVQRAFLGISAETLTSEKAKVLNLPSPSGVLIGQTISGGAAETAGLAKGDVIVDIQGHTITSFPELLEEIGTHRPGDEVSVDYYRNGTKKSTKLTLKNQQNNTNIIKQDPNQLARLGLDLAALNEREMATYQIGNGLKVLKIKPGAIQESTDMRAGFIILQINEKPITSESDISQIIQGLATNKMLIIEGFYPGRPYTYRYALKL